MMNEFKYYFEEIVLNLCTQCPLIIIIIMLFRLGASLMIRHEFSQAEGGVIVQTTQSSLRPSLLERFSTFNILTELGNQTSAFL